MASVYWSLGARDDIRQAVEFIGKDSPASPTYAASLVGRITAAIERLLERYPAIGRVIPEYDDDDLRELIIFGAIGSSTEVDANWLSQVVQVAGIWHAIGTTSHEDGIVRR